MRENVPDKNALYVVTDKGDQPIFVAADIEYNKIFYLVRTWKNTSNIIETLERCLVYNSVPARECRFGIGVICDKISDFLVADDVHGLRFVCAFAI
jgi:hypothetical protein